MAHPKICQRILLSAILLFSSSFNSSPLLGRASAQFISTNTPVPPLQWLNLSGLLQGAVSPPPLKDAAIGYDEGSRSVIIFGGESAAGLVQSQTYLLNLDTLTWSTPNPPANLQDTPAARSAAVYGVDFAASNRHGFVIIGGKGNDGTPLSDIWEYDFINQFWAEVNVGKGGPGARYGASGGVDWSTPYSVDTSVPGPVNTFYLAGGADRTQVYPLSDIWRLNISGTLSSNLPNDAAATWEKLNVGGSAVMFDQASTVIGSKVVGTGGCNTTTRTNDCPLQDSFISDARTLKAVNPGACPAPRTGSVLVRNYNPYTTTFNSQVFLLLGTVNHTNWDDGKGLDNGEVAILDTNTGTWSRILPAGDPSSTTNFPSPRAGAAAVSYQSGLVGASRTESSDILVFGGQDASGNLLSELWLLRGYKSSIDPSHLTWSGYGDGKLQTGINANGAGVKISYIQQCATDLTPTPTNSITPTPTKTHTPGPSHESTGQAFNTSTTHKALAPVSVALVQVAFLFLRLASPLYQNDQDPVNSKRYTYAGGFFTVASVGLGVGGLATAFTSLSSQGSSSSSHLKTTHGIAALVFFCLLYALILLLCATLFLRRSSSRATEASSPHRVMSPDVHEKADPDSSRSISRSILNQPPPSPPASPRRRTNSWGPSGWMFPQQENGSAESLPSDHATGSASATAPKRTFEVLNRPAQRMRRNSTGWTAVSTMEALSDTTHTHVNPPPRTLQDIDWLQRRRSLNAVGELDYAITQAQRERMLSPATADGLMINAVTPSNPTLPFPSLPITLLHTLVQAALLGMAIITLVALWNHAPKATFAVFLVWTVAIYIAMLVFASRKQPNKSILTTVYNRFSSEPQPSIPPLPSTPLSPTRMESSPLPPTSPYTHHQPPYRRAATPVDGISHLSPRSVEEDDDDDDLDEDTRQRMMEEELGRRDVSIVTVPKRKLWIANPS